MLIHIGTAISCHKVWHYLISFTFSHGRYIIHVTRYGRPHNVCVEVA